MSHLQKGSKETETKSLAEVDRITHPRAHMAFPLCFSLFVPEGCELQRCQGQFLLTSGLFVLAG